jgi:hypothetical protein
MPIELQARRYLFIRPPKEISRNDVVSNAVRFRLKSGKSIAPPSSVPVIKTSTPRLAYHHYHDVESAYWLFCEHVLTHIPSRQTPYSIDDIAPLYDRWLVLFDIDVKGSIQREDFINQDQNDAIEWLEEVGLHGTNLLLALPLGFHVSLRTAYVSLQNTSPPPESQGLWPTASFDDGLYDTFIDLIEVAEETYAQERNGDGTPKADASVNIRTLMRQLREPPPAA